MESTSLGLSLKKVSTYISYLGQSSVLYKVFRQEEEEEEEKILGENIFIAEY